jgi:PhzF family phenazine biosynthesis protein
MGQIFTQVDAFTSEPFKGNPAAVMLLDSPQSDQWMQNVATEMNLSETAFVNKSDEAFDLRWFTPLHEVDLCGHATLASAHVLWESGILGKDEIATFNTRSGILTARKVGKKICINLPSEPCSEAEAPAEIEKALGLKPLFVGRNRMGYLVEVESEKELRELTPDFMELAKINAQSIMVTAKSSSFDFISRFFDPHEMAKEDPVTGSAHCCLAPYWAGKLGKTEMNAFQASKRGGHLHLSLVGDRVDIIGEAVTVIRGELV